MNELETVLAAFHDPRMRRCRLARADGNLNALVPARALDPPARRSRTSSPSGADSSSDPLERRQMLVAPVPGHPRLARARAVRSGSREPADNYLRFLLPVVVAVSARARSRSSTRRTSSPSATRRSTSSTRSARSSAARSRSRKRRRRSSTRSRETVGARRASILVHDPATDTLQVVAAIGAGSRRRLRRSRRRPVQRVGARVPHAAFDASSRTARCSARPSALTGAARCSPCRSCGRRRDGGEPLGVVNLSDRRSRAAVHRRRPEARRGDRDADRHGDPERAPRARVARSAAPAAGDAARARPADEAPARRRRSSRRRRPSPRASCPPRASAATSTICSGSAADGRRDDRRRVGPRLPGRAHHGAGHERVGDPRAGHRRSRRDAVDAARHSREKSSRRPRCSSRCSTA